jgi:hypothetical protein
MAGHTPRSGRCTPLDWTRSASFRLPAWLLIATIHNHGGNLDAQAPVGTKRSEIELMQYR